MDINIEELKKSLRKLPELPVGVLAKDGQAIGGDAIGCHYEIYKRVFHLAKAMDGVVYPWVVFVLVVSGPEQRQQELIAEFEKVLGHFSSQFQPEEIPETIFLIWDANEAAERLKN